MLTTCISKLHQYRVMLKTNKQLEQKTNKQNPTLFAVNKKHIQNL